MAKRPNSRRNLDIAIERVAGRGPAFVQARTLMADAVVAQMLPDGAVKGGSALKLRFGDAGTRFSEDLDTARASGIDEYIGVLNAALEEGCKASPELPSEESQPRQPEFPQPTSCSPTM